MTRRVIRLPNGKLCGLGVYVESWRKLKQIAANNPRAGVRGFDHFASDAADILRELRRGMHDRINRHIAGHGVGRKWHHDWQRAALQCAHAVNTPRLVVRWVPPEFRARLAHRLTALEDCL